VRVGTRTRGPTSGSRPRPLRSRRPPGSGRDIDRGHRAELVIAFETAAASKAFSS